MDKKLKLLIHHHTVAYQNSEGIWLQSFIAEWIIQLSLHFDQIGLLLHLSDKKSCSIAEQIISICGKGFEGTLTIFAFPERRPKTKEKAKLTGTFDGVI